MPQHRKWRNDAEKQAAYRERKRQQAPKEKSLTERVERASRTTLEEFFQTDQKGEP